MYRIYGFKRSFITLNSNTNNTIKNTNRIKLLSRSYSQESSKKSSSSHLVCGKCNNILCATSDLFFFEWKRAIHLSPKTDKVLENIRLVHPDDSHAKLPFWRKRDIRCISCDAHIGLVGHISSSDKIFFSAQGTGIEMSLLTSPLLSISGYPSSTLMFKVWTELILMMETTPELQDVLHIQRLDHMTLYSTKSADLNTEILCKSDVYELLQYAKEHENELNFINIATILSRVYKLIELNHRRFIGQKNARLFQPRSHSEAPEDEIFSISNVQKLSMYRKSNISDNGQEIREMFWTFINATENRIQYGRYGLTMKNGYAQLVLGYTKLGIKRSGILEPLVQHAIDLLQVRSKYRITPDEASRLFIILFQSSPSSIKQGDCMKALATTIDETLSECTAGPDRNGMNLFDAPNFVQRFLPLHQCFKSVPNFHPSSLSLVFARLNANERAFDEEFSNILWTQKQKLVVILYELHLDGVLDKNEEYTLKYPHVIEACKKIYIESQKNSQLRYRTSHIILETLKSNGVKHFREKILLNDVYYVDFLLPSHNVVIMTNNNSSSANPHTLVFGKDPSVPDHIHHEPELSELSKYRQLEKLGYTVLQLSEEQLVALQSKEARCQYLSMQLEIALSTQNTAD